MSRVYADLPLHYGHVPPWLYERMSRLGVAIVEAIVMEYGKSAALQRFADPFWFQALGCVLGMDWHSSGITTSVLGALKRSVNERAQELGIYFCGGKGKHSRQTPAELTRICERIGLNGTELIRNSRLTAKVDNNIIQDGYNIYLHSFIVSDEGEWVVVQQGMNDGNGMARRYHWHSHGIQSFTEQPHSFIYGHNQGLIMDLTNKEANKAKTSMLGLLQESPTEILPEIKRLLMPSHHEVRAKDVNLKRLGSVLAIAHEQHPQNMEDFLLLEGVGPRTVQSLALVSELVHGTPTRFEDPARFSFAHGGKDGHPFPVPTKTYDEAIQVLEKALQLSKIGNKEKSDAIKKLSVAAQQLEKDFIPNDNFDTLIEKERKESWKYGGKTVFGDAKPPKPEDKGSQLSLF